jgi:hypothetical protein
MSSGSHKDKDLMCMLEWIYEKSNKNDHDFVFANPSLYHRPIENKPG